MKILYLRADGARVKFCAPREVIFEFDEELDRLMSSDSAHTFYPNLRDLWLNTIGENDTP